MPILHDIASFFLRTLKLQRATVFHQLSACKVQSRISEPRPSSGANSSTIRNDNNASDILTHFLSARDKYPQLMTQDQIIMHCMVNVVAGTGTSTTAIINVLKYLVANPEAQQRLYMELKAAHVKCPATWHETQSLPFLEGLVREGIRLRGVDGFNPLARVVKEEGMVLPNGMRLPPGTLVGIKPSVASVQQKTFGDRPKAFLPERWCKKDGESYEDYRERRGRMDRGDMSFGSGTRGCIGRGIASMEIYKLVASLVCQYKVSSLTGFRCEYSNLLTSHCSFCRHNPKDLAKVSSISSAAWIVERKWFRQKMCCFDRL